MTFITPMIAEKLGRHRWRLAEMLVFEHDGYRIEVPEGFVTDFASVPRIPFVFTLFGNRGHAAAVIHDWLYQQHPVGISKVDADELFRIALIEEGVKPWRARSMWLAVATFGQTHWDSGPDRRRVDG